MVWYPSEAIRCSVPSKSFPIVSRKGHVWHPMGNPSGLARGGAAPSHMRYPNAAIPIVLVPRNCLLEIAFTMIPPLGLSVITPGRPRGAAPTLNREQRLSIPDSRQAADKPGGPRYPASESQDAYMENP